MERQHKIQLAMAKLEQLEKRYAEMTMRKMEQSNPAPDNENDPAGCCSAWCLDDECLRACVTAHACLLRFILSLHALERLRMARGGSP